MNTLRVLDQIETVLRNAPHIPLTGLSILDTDRLMSVLEKVRSTLPEELKQARYLTQENQRIIREAQEKAEAVLTEAEERAAQKVADSEIMRVAREQADELTRRAKRAAEEMRDQAEAYARDVLAGLETELERLSSIARNGRVKLEKPHENAAQPEEFLSELTV